MSGPSSEAFVATVMPSVDLVHNLARRLVRRSTDAEDLAQDTLARAWEAWARGDRPDSVNPWLSTICLNLARDRARRAARDREIPWQDGLDPVDAVDVEAAAITRVQRGMVDVALWTLPEPQRIAIVLMDICGLTAAETAAITDAPRGTVLARVHRGRKALVIAVQERARHGGLSPGGREGPWPPQHQEPPGRQRPTGPPQPPGPQPISDPNDERYDERGGPQR